MAGVESERPEESPERVKGRAWWAITWRLLLIVVGIPAVWILRAAGVVDLSAWHAVGLSVILLLVALGDQFLALVLTT